MKGDYILLDCDFIITPRILFNDKSLSKTDIAVMGLIISLAFKNNYCYASNAYLADYINISIRTISDSLAKLKKLKYILIIYDNKRRKIYLNKEKIPIKSTNKVKYDSKNNVAENCYHKINSKNKKEYKDKKEIVPYWFEHPEVCKSTPLSDETKKEFEDFFKQFD